MYTMKYSLTNTLNRKPHIAHDNRRYMRVDAYGLLCCFWFRNYSSNTRFDHNSCFCNRNGNQYAVSNISLDGMLLVGDATFNHGDTYKFSVIELQKITGLSITLKGIVFRAKDNLIAVKFARMDTRNFENLKTALIYLARYPAMISEEFPVKFSTFTSN